MKNTPRFLVFIFSLFSCSVYVSCSSDNAPDSENPVEESENPEDALPPVETRNANADYAPAFEEQTRVPGVATETAYTTIVLASGLSSPWGMANLPDGDIIVTQKRGTMRILSASGTLSGEITGIPSVNSSGQGGLLDVAVDPDFINNRMLYWSFSQNGSNGTATAVAKGRLANNRNSIENAEVIYTAIPEFNGTAHYGSRLVWDADGNLFVSTGERSSTVTRPEAQELDAALGKVLRITTNGDAVADNPFIGQEGVLPEIYSYGHRNVQGLAIHPVTGDLWESELGPLGGDEINHIEPQNNYGWPVINYGLEYNGAPIGQGLTQQQGMEQPVYYWDPVISPSGITFYSGTMISEWTNNLFVAALSGQHIVRLVIDDNRVTGEERLLEDEGERFRDVLEGGDGALYAITDSGLIYRISL